MSQQINLFNPIFRKQKKYFSSVTMAQALGIICLACALLAVNASWRMRQLAAQVAATDAQLQARQTRLVAFKAQFPARQKSPTLAGEMAAAQSELTLLEQASGMLEHGSFGDTRGFSTYFRAFARQSVDGLWLTGLTIDGGGTQLAVQGNAMQPDLVPKYMRRLSNEPVMAGKTFASLNMETPAPLPNAAGATAQKLPYLKFSLQSMAVTPTVEGTAK